MKRAFVAVAVAALVSALAGVTLSQVLPSVPVVTSPTDGAMIDAERGVTIRWDPVSSWGKPSSLRAESHSYTLELTDPMTYVHITSLTEAVTAQSFLETVAGVWTLRVGASNTVGVNSQSISQPLTFCNAAAPSTPVSLTPAMGERYVSTYGTNVAVTLGWQEVTWGTLCNAGVTNSYIVENSLDNGATWTLSSKVTTPQARWSTNSFSGVVMWRVAAASSRQSAFSTAMSFTVCFTTAPNAPSADFPSGTAIKSGYPVMFMWSATSSWGTACSASSNMYEVHFQRGSDPEVTSNVPSGSTTFMANGLAVGSYTWFVCANNGDVAAKSETRTFFVEECKQAPSAVPVPTFPVNNTSVCSWTFSGFDRVARLTLLFQVRIGDATIFRWQEVVDWGEPCDQTAKNTIAIILNLRSGSRAIVIHDPSLSSTAVVLTETGGFTWSIVTNNGAVLSSSINASAIVCAIPNLTVPSIGATPAEVHTRSKVSLSWAPLPTGNFCTWQPFVKVSVWRCTTNTTEQFATCKTLALTARAKVGANSVEVSLPSGHYQWSAEMSDSVASSGYAPLRNLTVQVEVAVDPIVVVVDFGSVTITAEDAPQLAQEISVALNIPLSLVTVKVTGTSAVVTIENGSASANALVDIIEMEKCSN